MIKYWKYCRGCYKLLDYLYETPDYERAFIHNIRCLKGMPLD